MNRRDKILVGILFGLTSLAFVWPALSIGGTFAATDLTLIASPYREDAATEPDIGTGLQTDQVSQLPLVLEFFESLRNGDLQLWEPNQGAGMPLGTAVYNQLLLPWNLALLFVAGPIGPTLASFLAVYTAQLGMFLFARRLGLGVWGSALAAVAYVFSGPVTALHLRIQQVLLLPWVFYSIHGVITQRRVRYLVMTTVSVALTWLGGFPAGALFVLYAAGAFSIYMVTRVVLDRPAGSRMRSIWASSWPVLSAFVAGTLVAGVQLVPSYAFIQEADSLERSFPVWHRAGLVKLATAVSGRFFGTYQYGDWWWPEAGYSNPVEASSTLGVTVLLLLLMLVVRGHAPPTDDRTRPLRQFMMPMALLVLVGVYLGGAILGIFHQLPFLAENSFGRSRFLMFFALALVAGYVLDAALDRNGSEAPSALRAQVALALVAVALGVYEGLTVAAEESQVRFVASQLVVPAIAGGAALVALWLARPAAWLRGPLVVGVLAIELLWGAWGFTPGSPPEAFFREHSSFETIASDVGERGLFRFTGLGLFDIVPPNEAALLDLSDARYFYPVVGEYEELWHLIDPGLAKRPGDPWIPHLYTEDFDATSPVLDRMAVRYLAVPLSKPLQDVTSSPFVVSPIPGSPIELPAISAGVRGITMDLTLEAGCTEGWVVLQGRDWISRRLVREIETTATFPLPDVTTGGLFSLSGTHCEIEARSSESVIHLPLSEALSIVAVEDWVLYERGSSRSRVELASEIRTLDPDDLEVLADRASSDAVFVTGEVDAPEMGVGSARLVEDEPDRVVVRVESDTGGVLILRDAYSSGWAASVDSTAVNVVRVDHAFRGVVVPPGDHSVVFEYRPDPLVWGMLLAFLGLFWLGLAIVLLGRQQGRSTPH